MKSGILFRWTPQPVIDSNIDFYLRPRPQNMTLDKINPNVQPTMLGALLHLAPTFHGGEPAKLHQPTISMLRMGGVAALGGLGELSKHGYS